MAVDPNTGQTVINQPGFDMRYAGFLDPNAVGNMQAGQNQADQQSQLAQAMLSRGYTPNSGGFGAIAQVLQSLAGMQMLKKSQQNMQGLYAAQVDAANKAAIAKHAQDQADLDAAEKRAIGQATGIKEGETQIGLKYAPEQNASDAAKAAAVAQATLPTQMELENQKGKFQLGAAEISANAANRRGYIVSDASGNQHVITPSGQEIYTATSPGGGKLTAPQTALNEADVAALKNYTTRTAAAQQLSNNIPNFVAKYTGQDPQKVAQMTPQQQADLVRSVPTTSALAMALNPNYGGLDAISSDIGINAAGTKRPDPTDSVIAAEQKNTLSRTNTPEKNATILLNHYSDIQNLAKEQASVKNSIMSRQPPQAGAVPAAQSGPQNPAPTAPSGVHYIYKPQTGALELAQ